MPCRPFSIRTLLWLMLCVACFLGGIEFHKAQMRREERRRIDEQFGDLAEWKRLFDQRVRELKAKSQAR